MDVELAKRQVKDLQDRVLEYAKENDCEAGTVIHAMVMLAATYAVVSGVEDPKGKLDQTVDQAYDLVKDAYAVTQAVPESLRGKLFPGIA